MREEIEKRIKEIDRIINACVVVWSEVVNPPEHDALKVGYNLLDSERKFLSDLLIKYPATSEVSEE